MTAATLDELLAPLRADPRRCALLFDVDGTLAPIVNHADDAHVPELTRRPLITLARQYGVVACVTGRRAADAKRIVSLGSIAYLGSHGSETMRPGAVRPELDGELQAWARRVQAFMDEQFSPEMRRLRVRLEDKEAIGALHWRGAPDEEAAEEAVEGVATAAQEAGFLVHRGRKVLEVRPPVRIDKGQGIINLLRGQDLQAALYVGDDLTDLDAFDGLDELVRAGRLGQAICLAVRSDEARPELTERADWTIGGAEGVRNLLHALVVEA